MNSMARRLVLSIAALLWTASTALATSFAENAYSAPALYGTWVIFSQRSGMTLHAVDLATKHDVWVWSCTGRTVRSAPTVVGDVAYIWAGSDYDCMACAIDCRTGTSIWETRAEGWTFSSAVVAGDVVLFGVASHEHEVQAYDRTSGRHLWTCIDAELLTASGKDLLVARDRDLKLAILEARTGVEVFSCAFSNKSFTEPQAACNPKGIAVAGCDGAVVAVDMPARRMLWSVSTGVRALLPCFTDDGLFMTTSWSSRNASGAQALEKWNLATGAVESTVIVRGTCATYLRAEVYQDIIMVPVGGELVGLRKDTLQEAWRLPTGRPYGFQRIGNFFWFGTTGPRLVQLDPATGTTPWSYDQKWPASESLSGSGPLKLLRILMWKIARCTREILIGLGALAVLFTAAILLRRRRRMKPA